MDAPESLPGEPAGLVTPAETGSPGRARIGWWAAYLGFGLATVLVHFRLAGLPDPHVYTVLAHFGVAFFLYLAALPAARHLAGKRNLLPLLWCFLVATASLAAYIPSSFLLTPEVHRYRWDGEIAAAGLNPYEFAPEDPEVADLRKGFADPIPYPKRKGLYPPFAELTFYLMARLDRDQVVHYRILFSVMALLCGLAFLPLCRVAGVSSTRITVFLWHPLLIMETAGNAHLETLGLFFLLIGLALLVGGHHLTPMGSLAVATLIRPYPMALFPLYLRRIPPYRIVIFFLVLIGGTLPFAGAGRDLWTGMADYLGHARFNPGPYLLVEALFLRLGHPEVTRLAIGAIIGAIAVALYFTDDGTPASILRRAFYLSLPPLLLGPVINPWYMLWLLPFLALVPSDNPFRLAVLYLTGGVALAYVHLAWGMVPGWISILEFGPGLLLALLALWRYRWGPRPVPAGLT